MWSRSQFCFSSFQLLCPYFQLCLTSLKKYFLINSTLLKIFRVSHNTWEYKNALERPLNDNVESWEVSHFEAKDHTFYMRGVRFWCVDFQIINFSKKPTTQILVIFIYVVNLPNFWLDPARPTDHLQAMDRYFHPVHAWYTHIWIKRPKSNVFIFHFTIFTSKPKKKFPEFFYFFYLLTKLMNPMCFGTPCIHLQSYHKLLIYLKNTNYFVTQRKTITIPLIPVLRYHRERQKWRTLYISSYFYI
jgi:hypothetical protein